MINTFSNNRRRRAFTLIEIMIAIGIFLIGMIGVLAVYAVAVDFHRRAVDNMSIALLAENMLNEITADFVPRAVKRVPDPGNPPTFAESFIDLACRYKHVDDEGKLEMGEGVPAPDMRGFNVEVSIYPLPRDLWLDRISSQSTSDGEEREFDRWIFENLWDVDDAAPAENHDDLLPILNHATQYKVVVRIIRGTGPARMTDTFETILVPKEVD